MPSQARGYALRSCYKQLQSSPVCSLMDPCTLHRLWRCQYSRQLPVMVCGQDTGQLHAMLFDCIQNLQTQSTSRTLQLTWTPLNNTPGACSLCNCYKVEEPHLHAKVLLTMQRTHLAVTTDQDTISLIQLGCDLTLSSISSFLHINKLKGKTKSGQ